MHGLNVEGAPRRKRQAAFRFHRTCGCAFAEIPLVERAKRAVGARGAGQGSDRIDGSRPGTSADVAGSRDGLRFEQRPTRSRALTTMRSRRPRTRSASAWAAKASASTTSDNARGFSPTRRGQHADRRALFRPGLSVSGHADPQFDQDQGRVVGPGLSVRGAERDRRQVAAPPGRQGRRVDRDQFRQLRDPRASRSTDRCR